MRHLIFDTETTNLVHNTLQPIHKQPRIIEYYGCILDDTDMTIKDTLHQVLDPQAPINSEVTKITGFSQADVTGKPTFNQWHPFLMEFMASADVVVAHNLSYDLTVVDFEFKRIEQSVRWPARKVCTVESTEHIRGHRLNLNALHEHLFGEGFTGAHRADVDVGALTRCYIELLKRGEV